MNATHSLVSQLEAAAPGDIVQIETSATVGNLGTTAGTLGNGTLVNATSITVTNFVAPGQVITIDTLGNQDTALVDAETPAGSDFILTLHSGLNHAHNAGVAVTPLANTIGIGEALTLQGDPANPVPTLLNAFTIEFFPQNSTPGPDDLQRLALTAVSGNTSSELTIAGDTFNITSTTSPIDVVSGGTLSIVNDTFTTIGAGTIDTVVAGTTGTGAITFSGNKISLAGNVAASALGAVALTSTSGPITLSNDSLGLTGSVSINGIYVSTAGNVVLSSISESVSGAVGTTGIDINGADVTLSNLTINLGATTNEGLEADATGDLVFSGTNSVTIAGNVLDDGIELTGAGNATVSNITLDLKGNADDGLVIEPTGSITLTNANVTVDGNLGSNGIDLDNKSSINISGITLLVKGSADDGLYVLGYSNVSVGGTESVTITGAVASYGVDLYAQDGNITVSTSLAVTLGSSAFNPLYADANGDLTITGTVNLQVTGAVSYIGAQLVSGAAMTLSTINVTLDSTALSGLEVSGYTLNVTGAITVKVSGAVSDDAAYFECQSGDFTIANTIDVNAASSGASGLGIKCDQGALLDSGRITVSVTGNVGSDGASLDAVGKISLSGALSVTLGGTADYGMYLHSTAAMTVNGPLSVSVAGAVTDDGLNLDTGAGDVSITSSISVTLGSTAKDGANLESDAGDLTDTAAFSVKVAGNLLQYGADIYADYNETLGGNVAVSLGGKVEYGLDASADQGYLKNGGTITVSLAGQLSSGGDGAYLYAKTGAVLSNINITLSDGTVVDDQIYEGANIQSVYGDLYLSNAKVQVKGSVAADLDGLNLYSQTASIFTSNVSVNLSSTAFYGLEVSSTDGSVTMANTSLTVGGNVVEGADIGAGSAMNISGFIGNLQGTSDYGLNLEASSGNMAVSGVQFQEAGAVTHDAVFLKTTTANLAVSNVTISLGSTVGDDGFYPQAGYGDLSVRGVKLTATGLISLFGFEMYSQGDMTASGNSITLNGGVTKDDMYAVSYGGSVTISQNQIVNQGLAAAGIDVLAAGDLVLSKNRVKLSGGVGTAALLSGTSGNPQTIINNIFATGGQGTGLAFSGGATVAALVQDNNFQNNKIGVAITGDDTNAGDIDLGGGLLGSKGGNNFDGYTGLAGNFAIALSNTDATSTVFALDNLFSLGTNPVKVVQDQGNGGTGIIDV